MFSPLSVEFIRSRYLQGFTYGISGLVALLVLASAFDPFTKLLLLLVECYSIWALRRFPVNESVAGLEICVETGRFWVRLKNAQLLEIDPPKALFRSSGLVLIKIAGVAPVPDQWLVLLPDMMSQESWRRLQVVLRWSVSIKSSW